MNLVEQRRILLEVIREVKADLNRTQKTAERADLTKRLDGLEAIRMTLILLQSQLDANQKLAAMLPEGK